jgi:hypothetical protein
MQYFSTTRTRLVKLIALLFVCSFCAERLYAWNIICGVSVLVENPSLRAQKWTSDSESLNGIGHFYLGLAELQDVETNNLTDEAKHQVEVDKIGVARTEFDQASQHLATAISVGEKVAAQSGNPDGKAMSELSLRRYGELQQDIDSFNKAIDGHTLPELGKLQDAIDLALKITSFGMDVSQSHMGMPGHSMGGSDVRW